MAALWFLAGFGVEVLNTFLRKWSVERLQCPRSAVLVLGGMVLRMLGTATILMLAFRHSPSSGAAGLVGYLASRWVMIWWINRQTDIAEGR
jgi:hypothetical protein